MSDSESLDHLTIIRLKTIHAPRSFVVNQIEHELLHNIYPCFKDHNVISDIYSKLKMYSSYNSSPIAEQIEYQVRVYIG